MFLVPAVKEYWKHDRLHPVHSISKYTGYTRFEEIKRFLNISTFEIPKETASDRLLCHGKVDPLLNQLPYASQSLQVPSSNMRFNEAMISCTGQSVNT